MNVIVQVFESIFVAICFHLVTTMYERYCRREPVYFLYAFLACHDRVWTFLSKRSSLLFLLRVSIYPRQCMAVIVQ